MKFHKIDLQTWKRRECFEHYVSSIPCTYSLTVKLDITKIREKNLRLYPTMLYCITKVVNRHPELRTAYNAQGELGIYEEMNPSYAIFHKESESFSLLWTEFTDDYRSFCTSYEKDLQTYGQGEGMIAKPHMPENCIDVSMIPWASFTGRGTRPSCPLPCRYNMGYATDSMPPALSGSFKPWSTR